MMTALDAGADDFSEDDGDYEILTTTEAYDGVESALAQAGIEPLVSKITMVPDTTLALDGDDARKMQNLLDALDELDDVKDVYMNGELPDDEEE